MTAASGGINGGVTKYVAEYKSSDEKVKVLLSAALKITLGCSFLCGILMIVFHKFLSKLILLTPDYGYVFIIFGLTVFLYALNMMLISVLNGYKEFKTYVAVSIAGSLAGLVFTLGFVFILGLRGALIGSVTFQSVMFFITLRMVRKLPWVSREYFKSKFDGDTVRKYFRYTVMTFVTAATVPVSQLILRRYVMSHISVLEAGWWEAMNRLSGAYLMVITSSFGVYYLPRLSELKGSGEIRKEILKAYKVIIPMLTGGFTLIYFLRFFIVRVLFTEEFAPMEHLFVWQLLGDFFKISGWLLAFLMVAKSMTKLFITTEILFSGVFVGLGFLLVNMNGVVGVTQAYWVNYVLYSVMMIFVFKKIIL
jgi:PST family polysaccharide transporter